MSFESNNDMADSAYTQDELRPHTDSTYSNDAPGLQLLLCCLKQPEENPIWLMDLKLQKKFIKKTKIFIHC